MKLRLVDGHDGLACMCPLCIYAISVIFEDNIILVLNKLESHESLHMEFLKKVPVLEI